MTQDLEHKVDLTGWYAVFPGSEKLDLGPKKAVAYCEFESHAQELAKRWAPYSYIEKVGEENA
jgi:hypothetical protein